MRAHAPGFEWFVAWRHLRDPERKSRRTLLVGLVLILLGAVALLAARVLEGGADTPGDLLPVRHTRFSAQVHQGGVIVVIVGSVVTYLGLLFASFTVFTAISIFGVFLGTGAPIVALSVMSGFEADLKGKIRGAKADVVVTTPDEQPFAGWEAVRARIAAVRGVIASTPYLEGEVMIKSGNSPAGIMLRGIEPASAPAVLDLGGRMREGRIDDLAHPERAAPTIILGEELFARTLRVFMGSEVDVVCPLCAMGPTGPIPGLRRFRVAGHFYSGMYEFDSKLAYVSLAEAQRFFHLPGEVTGIDVRAHTPTDAAAVADAVQAALGPRFEVRSWEALNQGLFMALKLEKIAMFIVLAFIALVASFSIVSNLIMLVTEKAREVAILKSMGASDGAILRIFFAEGLYIGLLGLGVGVAAGILGCVLISGYGLPLPTDVYYIDRLPVMMRAGEIVGVAALALLLCCLATVYPAILASRMRPVEGLRYE